MLIPKDTLEHNFYKILEEKTSFKVTSSLEGVTGTVATIGRLEAAMKDRNLYRIITSGESMNSDRIYIYE
ncbi:hypothetical protein IJF86_02900 [Candidatus Saccharibacteria bacterium]|nr:hypothetical protein [Candidatus Saccharibacteria bacterium]